MYSGIVSRTLAVSGSRSVPMDSVQRWPLTSVCTTRSWRRSVSVMGEGFCFAGGGDCARADVARKSARNRRVIAEEISSQRTRRSTKERCKRADAGKDRIVSGCRLLCFALTIDNRKLFALATQAHVRQVRSGAAARGTRVTQVRLLPVGFGDHRNSRLFLPR